METRHHAARGSRYLPFLLALISACFLIGIAIGYAVGF